MNVVLAAALVLGGVTVGAVFGFLAGIHATNQVRALAVLDAQRDFRTVAGFVDRCGHAPVAVITATHNCAEALRVAAAELSSRVVGS